MSLQEIAEAIHKTSVDHGFWPEEGRNFGEMIALAHSELSEALEAHRAGEPAVYVDDNGKPEGTAVEIADTIIRCLDTLADVLKDTEYSVDNVVGMKMAYNETRPFKHGKVY